MSNFMIHNLSRLTTFGGRETRAQFWPYAGALVALYMAIFFVVMTALMGPLIPDAQAFEMVSTVMVANSIILVVVVSLFAAAVVRRLHDRGMSGWWGLMPLPFLTFAMVAMPKLFADFAGPTGPDIGLFGLIFINNLIYNVMMVILIVLLAKRSDPAINRYGPPPAIQT